MYFKEEMGHFHSNEKMRIAIACAVSSYNLHTQQFAHFIKFVEDNHGLSCLKCAANQTIIIIVTVNNITHFLDSTPINC